MHARTILTAIGPLLLSGALMTACDGGDKAKDTKAGDAKVDAKKADAKAKAKADEAKAAEAKAAEAKAEEAKADEAKADEAKAEEAKADEAKADEAKADEAKADEAKADEAKAAGDKKPAKKSNNKPEAKADAGPKVDAKGLFMKKCKNCHGSTGNGDTKLGKKHNISDWTKPGWKAKWPQSKVVGIITNGKSGTKMKAFKEKLTADEIKALASYSRKLGK